MAPTPGQFVQIHGEDDNDPLDGVVGDAERLQAERMLIEATNNSARPEDGPQPAVVDG